MNTKSSDSPSRSRRVAYTLAAGAAAGTAGLASTEADAFIVYNAVPQVIPQFGSVNFNLDIYEGSYSADIRLKNYVFGTNYQGVYVNYFPGKVVSFFTNGSYYVSALSEGDLIDATTVGPAFSATMAYGAVNPNAEFNNVDGAFIGLSFPDTNNDPLYGWIRVKVDNAAGVFEVIDWAYNSTPGNGIRAGTVPEPGTLGLLAAGALGVAGMRRRRAEQN